jgi:hypothetical protein
MLIIAGDRAMSYKAVGIVINFIFVLIVNIRIIGPNLLIDWDYELH